MERSLVVRALINSVSSVREGSQLWITSLYLDKCRAPGVYEEELRWQMLKFVESATAVGLTVTLTLGTIVPAYCKKDCERLDKEVHLEVEKIQLMASSS